MGEKIPPDEGDVRLIREALEYYSMMAAKNADREGHVGYLLDDALAALERILSRTQEGE